MAHKTTALAVLSFSLAPGAAEIQLLPAGPSFRSSDGSGRPDDVPFWRIDAAIAERLIARMRTKLNRIVIDYEHQTLHAEENGKPAPAAGWFVGANIEWREGQGLFATHVKWTDKAAAYIAAEEYLYDSPVFEYDRITGAVLDIRMAALTNYAGLTGMSAVALKAINDFTDSTDLQPEETLMNETLKKLLATLGLPGDALEADALAAVAALKAGSDNVAALKASAESATAEVAALKAQAPDPAKFVPISTMQELQGQIAALSGRINQSEAAQVIEQAMDEGKLLEPQRAWAEDLGKTNLAALKAFVASAPAIAALKGTQTNGNSPAGAGGGASQTDAELAVMKAMGLTADEFKKGKE